MTSTFTRYQFMDILLTMMKDSTDRSKVYDPHLLGLQYSNPTPYSNYSPISFTKWHTKIPPTPHTTMQDRSTSLFILPLPSNSFPAGSNTLLPTMHIHGIKQCSKTAASLPHRKHCAALEKYTWKNDGKRYQGTIKNNHYKFIILKTNVSF